MMPARTAIETTSATSDENQGARHLELHLDDFADQEEAEHLQHDRDLEQPNPERIARRTQPCARGSPDRARAPRTTGNEPENPAGHPALRGQHAGSAGGRGTDRASPRRGCRALRRGCRPVSRCVITAVTKNRTSISGMRFAQTRAAPAAAADRSCAARRRRGTRLRPDREFRRRSSRARWSACGRRARRARHQVERLGKELFERLQPRPRRVPQVGVRHQRRHAARDQRGQPAGVDRFQERR